MPSYPDARCLPPTSPRGDAGGLSPLMPNARSRIG